MFYNFYNFYNFLVMLCRNRE